MRAEEHRFTPRSQLLNEAAQDQRGADVEAGEGLIQQQEIGVVHERRSEQDFLAHALRVARDGGVAVIVE